MVILAQIEFFLNTPAKYNCSGPPSFKSKRYRLSTILFHHYQHAKIIQSICSVHQIICESHTIFKVLPFFDHTHSVIIKVNLSFHKFVSACKKSAQFIDSYLRSTTSFIMFWDFLMFYQIFLSSQVKRYAIITYKHGIYELPHELSNDLRLRILGN